MRVIEHEMLQAVRNYEYFRKDNTRVECLDGWVRIYLHNNLIAEVLHCGGTFPSIYIDNCGWNSRTTQSRLNALLSGLDFPLRVFTKKWQHYVSMPTGSCRLDCTYGYHKEGFFNEE